ncbi:transposase [Synechococcus sp. R6-10]|uniref:RNA-guided endonuclease InsQ/TnpB family protein n=1 Tax=Synechococcus sp. R6-10 TaxID=2291956 RepID=UPI0039C1BC99
MSSDIVAYEDLPVRNLVWNHHLAKSIHDASWSLFTGWLDYYGKVFNKVVVAVPPQYTSQDCSRCGHRVKKTLSTRTHQCPQCGVVLCRDENAAINILRKGLELLGEEWNNGTFGQKGAAPKGGTPGEKGLRPAAAMSTAAVEGQPDTVSAVAEPGTRIPCL